MKYGTICSKHNQIENAAQSIQKEVSCIQDILNNIDPDLDTIKSLAENFKHMENLLSMIDDYARDIAGTVELCLDDGQRMEDGLVKKQHTINEQCDTIDRLENEISDHENTISDLNDTISTLREDINDLSYIIDNSRDSMRG